MAPSRMETKPVIFCLKTVLLLYSFVFWVRKTHLIIDCVLLHRYQFVFINTLNGL